ncbi:MAG: hypothetical protein KF886_11390 [Candidatus Hydrogenedentes bacterium]|nr:hypothetical protein [Candidatus Hydrogenedentota bacterium]
MVPDFDSRGNLPPGVHSATWTEFIERFGYTAHRRTLIDGIRSAILPLRAAGCSTIYINGSFVTDKAAPLDFDAAWATEGVDLERLLALVPVFFRFENKRAAQKAKFGGEFFPSTTTAGPAGRTFLEFFQIDRGGRAKGIVRINLEDIAL